MNCAVVVPVYRDFADEYERQSFSSSCRLCRSEENADLFIVTHSAVDLSTFLKTAEDFAVEVRVKLFPSLFFKGVYGYNKLMLDRDFYESFSSYDYILISQLDAYVFKHELIDWCKRGYDYVGAPLFVPGFYNQTTYATVGNGGLSLRRTSAFLSILGEKSRIGIGELLSFRRPYNPRFTFRKKLIYFLMLLSLGRSRKVLFFLSRWVAEDVFFSFSLQGTSRQLKVPSAEEGALFSFDLAHDFWYGQIGGAIPFGVHRWNQFNSDFWRSRTDLP